jgi:hypothetical protein
MMDTTTGLEKLMTGTEGPVLNEPAPPRPTRRERRAQQAKERHPRRKGKLDAYNELLALQGLTMHPTKGMRRMSKKRIAIALITDELLTGNGFWKPFLIKFVLSKYDTLAAGAPAGDGADEEKP